MCRSVQTKQTPSPSLTPELKQKLTPCHFSASLYYLVSHGLGFLNVIAVYASCRQFLTNSASSNAYFVFVIIFVTPHCFQNYYHV